MTNYPPPSRLEVLTGKRSLYKAIPPTFDECNDVEQLIEDIHTRQPSLDAKEALKIIGAQLIHDHRVGIERPGDHEYTSGEYRRYDEMLRLADLSELLS
jgi:hypothetical protein